MERNYPIHEQIMYESIMDGCVYIGDEFISMIEGELTSKQKEIIVESINGYIINNCTIYGDVNPASIFTEGSLLNYAISKVLEEQKYQHYPKIYGNIVELGMWRARRLKSIGKKRIKASKTLNKSANEKLGWAKDRLKNTGTSLKRAKSFAQTGLYGKAAGSLFRGGAQMVGAIGAGMVGGGRKLQSGYLKYSGNKFINKPGVARAAKSEKDKDKQAINRTHKYI